MSMADRDGLIWFDGEMTPWREANTHVLTHTLHYGMGVFEGIRAYKARAGTAVFRLREHVDRLFDSAHILRMNIPYDKQTITRACIETVKQNQLDDAYIRPICFYGSESMGLRADNLRVHVAIAAWSWGPYLGDGGLEKGIRIKTSSHTRHHTNTAMCKAKAGGNYMNSILALQEALDCGYDEALLLDNAGNVVEGSGENIFLVRNGKLITPDLTSALEGITRATIITLAEENHFQIIERNITRDEVYIANEVFFTGTAAEVTPVREMDARVIGAGTRGQVTEKLQQLYFRCVKGEHEQHEDWLTYLNRSN